MRYGHFDDEAREYVITRPDTPRSWSNYLGSRLYGGIITQNAGGYSFFKSGGLGRVLRFRFNGVPEDEPGRFVYLRDDADGDFWSASWQPVGKPLATYGEPGDAPLDGEQRCMVRHGLGYSIFTSEYRGIRSEATFFVPKGQAFEYWSVKVTNTDERPRTVSAFSYAELANEWNYKQDLENLQYSQYVVLASYRDGVIHRRNSTREAFAENWFALVGQDVASYDTDREAFLGRYRTPSAPRAVERGECRNTETVGDNSCASLHARLELAPGETKHLIFMLGIGSPDEPWDDDHGYVARPGRELMAEYGTPERVEAELAAIRDEWRDYLAPLQVATPDPEMNSMINVWHAYQTHMTFNWSRGVSLIEAGDRDGLGYRDTVQDMLAVTHAIPEAVRERLDMILTGQTEEGGAMPLVKPLTHNPGHEATPTLEEYRSDDALWLPITVANFVYETGDARLPRHGAAVRRPRRGDGLRAPAARDRVLARALGAERAGAGAPGGLERHHPVRHRGREHVLHVPHGERPARGGGARRADAAGRTTPRGPGRSWSGLSPCWSRRGTAAGTSAASPRRAPSSGPTRWTRARSTWSRTCGRRSPAPCRASGRSARWTRCTSGSRPSTASRCARPRTRTRSPASASRSWSSPWATRRTAGSSATRTRGPSSRRASWAAATAPTSTTAASCPPSTTTPPRSTRWSPTSTASSRTGRSRPRFGQARNPWLTGTASWSYVGVTQYILGIRPELEGLRIDPCLPDGWDGYEVTRRFRGMGLTIRVSNPDGVETGVASVTIGGKAVELVDDGKRGALVPVGALKDGAVLDVVLG